MNIKEVKIINFLKKSNYNERGFSVSEISENINEKSIYHTIKKLVDSNKIEISEKGRENKMIVFIDKDFKPCFSKEQIENCLNENLTYLIEECRNRKDIMSLIKEKINIEDPETLGEFFTDMIANLKEWNDLVTEIKKKNLYHRDSKYSRFEWRPQKANRYKLS